MNKVRDFFERLKMAVFSKKGRKLRHGKKKTLSRKGILWICVGSTLGVLLIAGIIVGVIWFKNTFSYQHDPITEDLGELGVDQTIEYPDEITNIALFGLDSRAAKPEGAEYQKGLSDSIMIISVNATTGSIKLVSIMRDTLVKVDGRGYQKINAAYSLGGPELAIKTLNQTFRLNIQDYATVDFEGMAEIVDAVGGVEVELTSSEVYHTNVCMEEIVQVRGLKPSYVQKSGKQVLNGLQAVSFSRIRYVPTINGTRDDYGRTERQRLVMTRLFEKALDLPLTQYPTLIRTMLPYIQTSMGYDDIFDLAKVLKADGISMQQNRLPIDESVITSGLSVPYIGSCVYYDLEYSADLLNAFFFDDITFEEYVAKNGVRKNNWYGAAGYSDVFIPPDGSTDQSTQSSGKNTATSNKTTSSSNKNTTTSSNKNTTTSSNKNTTTSNKTSSGSGTSDLTTDTNTEPDITDTVSSGSTSTSTSQVTDTQSSGSSTTDWNTDTHTNTTDSDTDVSSEISTDTEAHGTTSSTDSQWTENSETE